jgi:ubiquitin carboxyl-terminal hydrolase 8
MNTIKQPKPTATSATTPVAGGTGKAGLMNLGNTCFLNACLQILNHTYELNDIYTTIFATHSRKNLPETVFFKEWVDLHNLLWTQDGVVSPLRFVQTVHHLAQLKGRDLFTQFSQNDIHEFIHLFIETIHTSISRKINIEITGTPRNQIDKLAIQCYSYLQTSYKNEYSEIMKIFYGIYVSKIAGVNNGTTYSTKPELFFILDLPIPVVGGNIYDCLDLFVKEEIMDGDNSWRNEETGKTENVIKSIAFWNLPDILIISFKRFSPCGRRKRQDNIDFPMKMLDLSPYICGYNPQKYKYNLFGVCNHFGNCGGGHYTSFVNNYLDEWIHFNDGNVDVYSETVVSPAAYCLFYRRME